MTPRRRNDGETCCGDPSTPLMPGGLERLARQGSTGRDHRTGHIDPKVAACFMEAAFGTNTLSRFGAAPTRIARTPRGALHQANRAQPIHCGRYCNPLVNSSYAFSRAINADISRNGIMFGPSLGALSGSSCVR